MPLYRAQVILPFFTNLPTDVVVNQFHFNIAADDPDNGLTIYENLKTFYETAYGTTAASRASYVDWPQAYVKVFNLDDPTPRIPYESPPLFAGAGTNASTIPTEVACVLSFRAAAISGVRFQRLYNRVYLGALPSTAIIAGAADAFPRINPTFISSVISAAQGLLAAGDSDGAIWSQVSNATGSAVPRTIVGGWVDNSPDTQRRRSVLATLRNNWSPLP